MMYPGVHNVITFLRVLDPAMFDMKKYFSVHRCGTPLCIGGWCAYVIYLTNPEKIAPSTGGSLAQIANIPRNDAELICYPETDYDYSRVTRDDAIWMLEKYRDTGEVDWNGVGDRIQERQRLQGEYTNG